MARRGTFEHHDHCIDNIQARELGKSTQRVTVPMLTEVRKRGKCHTGDRGRGGSQKETQYAVFQQPSEKVFRK